MDPQAPACGSPDGLGPNFENHWSKLQLVRKYNTEQNLDFDLTSSPPPPTNVENKFDFNFIAGAVANYGQK